MCWKLRLRPQMGVAGAAAAAPEPFQGIICQGQFPEFALCQGGECACGAIGDGTSAEAAEHFLAAFLRQPGVAAVEIAWHWDDGAGAPAFGAEALTLREFARRNGEKRLRPEVAYTVTADETPGT
jgi:hypothetical protein